jgi:hypothetical protein
MEDTGRTLAVLLTMHRSGSSVATSILNRLGMSLGPFELLDSAASNTHGHFEAVPILDLNKDVQRFVYGFDEDMPGSEQSLDAFVAGWRGSEWPEIPEEFLTRGHELIAQLIDSAPISGFKDPRTVLLWPFWKRVLAGFPSVRIIPVALLRSPHAIAMSLCSRSLTTAGVYGYWDCLDMVAIHYDRLKAILESHHERAPRVRFGQPEFLDDLAGTARYCQLPWDPATAAGLIDHASERL